MVFKFDAEATADGRQVSRKNSEMLSSHLDRAFVEVIGNIYLIAVTARSQYLSIEGNIMRYDEVNVFKKGQKPWPELAKVRRCRDMFIGKPVDMGKHEIAAWRLDEVMLLFDDSIAANAHESNRASAVSGVVSRLKIDGEKRRWHSKTLWQKSMFPTAFVRVYNG